MQDMLKITGLKIETHIGIHAFEKKIEQPICIDILIPIDTSQINDELNNTLDYSTLCQGITTYIEQSSFNLIETLANSLALWIHKNFQINSISLTVNKPTAIPNAAGVSISIHRTF